MHMKHTHTHTYLCIYIHVCACVSEGCKAGLSNESKDLPQTLPLRSFPDRSPLSHGPPQSFRKKTPCVGHFFRSSQIQEDSPSAFCSVNAAGKLKYSSSHCSLGERKESMLQEEVALASDGAPLYRRPAGSIRAALSLLPRPQVKE